MNSTHVVPLIWTECVSFLYSSPTSFSYQGIDKDDQTKEELQEQPLTNQNPGTSIPAIQAPPTITGQNQLEEIIILDQNGQALQCERMVRETGLALTMGHREAHPYTGIGHALSSGPWAMNTDSLLMKSLSFQSAGQALPS